MKVYKNGLDKENLEVAESLLFNGNGYIGLRNNLTEEYYDDYKSIRETYINGYYEEVPIHYPEVAFGFTPKKETMISVIDTQTVHIYINNNKVNYENYVYHEHERYLDIEKGVSIRSFVCEDKFGNKTKILIKRMVPFTNKNLYYDVYEFNKINHDYSIDLINDINFNSIKIIDRTDPRISHEEQKLNICSTNFKEQTIEFCTKNSKLHKILKYSYNINSCKQIELQDKVQVTFNNVNETFIKATGYLNDINDEFNPDFYNDESTQKIYLDNFWKKTKISIVSEKDIETSVNYGSFALLQSTGDAISAKGLSGNGYEGHYFWDGEMYVLPFFLYTNPEIARRMLEYRIKMLPKAIENRKLVGYKSGALYPWRTISGVECSAFFEAGMAQHHINADICYALIKYVETTGDLSILDEGGFDVMEQTSMFYKDLLYYRDGTYHIDKVTGPDEYSTLVNDNLYTNIMVKYQFEKLIEFGRILGKKVENADEYTEMAKHMYVEINDKLNILEQDRDFLNKEKWPYNEDKYPLLLHYHPLEIYRYQVCKQADAVLAIMLHPNIVPNEIIKNTIEYYDDVTVHDSSLSFSAFSTVYSRLGVTEKAYQYFLKNCRIDIDNLHGNTKDGIHTASMGGTYITILYGFLGLEVKDEKLIINPNLPEQIKQIRIPVTYKNDLYEIFVNEVTQEIIMKENCLY